MSNHGAHTRIDTELISNLGYSAAAVFAKVWFWLESIQCNHRRTDGVFKQEELFNLMTGPTGARLIKTKKTFQNALYKLRDEGLLIIEQLQHANTYRIDFDQLTTVLSPAAFEFYEQYSYSLQNEGRKNCVPETTGDDRDENFTYEKIASLTELEDQLRKFCGPATQKLRTCHIYRKRFLEEGTTLPSSNEDGAPAPPTSVETLEPARSPLVALARVVFPGFKLTKDRRSQIFKQTGMINALEMYGGPVILDTTTCEQFSLWRMVINWRGEKNGWPDVSHLYDQMQEFIGWIRSETNQRKLEKIIETFPDWRTRLFIGDYMTFIADVKAMNNRPKRDNLPSVYTDINRPQPPATPLDPKLLAEKRKQYGITEIRDPIGHQQSETENVAANGSHRRTDPAV